MKIYDISRELLSAPVYPGDEAPVFRRAVSMEKGAAYNLTEARVSAHHGTHVDAPSHFLREGRTIERIDLGRCVGPCSVRRVCGEVDRARILPILAGCGERLLLAGANTILPSACRAMAERGLLLLGLETLTVGPPMEPAEAHRIVLGADIALVENLDLAGVPEGEYFLVAAPLKWGGAEGAPCRALLLEGMG